MNQASLFNEDTSILQVSELVRGLREVVEAKYGELHVEGELSNFRRYRSGHCYFTLKDDTAQIRGVMWRGNTRYLFFEPQDGMLVQLSGYASIYEQRGELQIIARSMKLAGEGALQKAFEALKQKLDAEGLFAPQYKQPLPPFPETIGIVTSGDGAALHDILSILERRFPQVAVLVFPVHVQGLGAAAEIAEAIATFDAMSGEDPLRPDLLIVGRGGGSVEDLWAFNEEVVARAIFSSRVPIISAVGHETDYAISDFVADVRAATPSMAAELAVPDHRDVEALVLSYHVALHDHLMDRISTGLQHIDALTHSHAFHRPVDRLRQTQQRLDDLTARLRRSARHALNTRRQHLDGLQHQLTLLDPHRPLQRGYARIEREDGSQIRRAANLDVADTVSLRFLDGDRRARIVK